MVEHPIGETDPQDPGVTKVYFAGMKVTLRNTSIPIGEEADISLCTVCGRPGRFKVNGKGPMAGRHRACRKPKVAWWKRAIVYMPKCFGFGRKGST